MFCWAFKGTLQTFYFILFFFHFLNLLGWLAFSHLLLVSLCDFSLPSPSVSSTLHSFTFSRPYPHSKSQAFHLLAFSKNASIFYLLSPSYRGWNSSYPRLTFHHNSRPQSLQDLVTHTHFPSHISLTLDNINISVPPILTKWSLNSAFTDRLPSCRTPGSYHPISWFQLPRYRLHFLPELKSHSFSSSHKWTYEYSLFLQICSSIPSIKGQYHCPSM